MSNLEKRLTVNVRRLDSKETVNWSNEQAFKVMESLRLTGLAAHELATEVLRLNVSGENLNERKVAMLQAIARRTKQAITNT